MTLRPIPLNAERSALLALGDLTAKLGRAKPLPAHLATGERGELEALFYLRRRGFRVIERRWRSPDHNGDLDLIAWAPESETSDTLCFIEVKSRSTRDLTPAASAINDAKRSMLRRMARSFLRTLPRENRAETLKRFDVVSVYITAGGAECELLQNAFPWRGHDYAGYGV